MPTAMACRIVRASVRRTRPSCPVFFGPITVDGGPGSIWRIDGRTGAVTLFANVTLGGVPNSGPALGALAFDPVSHQLFVADRDTGMIHRFTLDGVERGRFDHGSQALSRGRLAADRLSIRASG